MDDKTSSDHKCLYSDISMADKSPSHHKCFYSQGFQSGPVPGTFTRLRSCIVPTEITEPPKISGGQNHKYDGRLACGIFFIKN